MTPQNQRQTYLRSARETWAMGQAGGVGDAAALCDCETARGWSVRYERARTYTDRAGRPDAVLATVAIMVLMRRSPSL